MRRLPVLLSTLLLSGAAVAADAPGVVSNLSITSPHTEDVSSLEAWSGSFIKPGMTEQQRALAVWTSVVKFRHQEQPPREFRFSDEGHVHDPIKTFNVYGYGQCCCASCNIAALARHAGLAARGWGIIAHSVPEVRVDGQWQMLDASLMTYFPVSKTAGARNAGVEELATAVGGWLDANPGLRGNDEGLRQFMRGRGWAKGPELVANCPFIDDNGWFMAATHGWYAPMQEYAVRSKLFLYEYGYTLGYRVNVQLRRGERLERPWGNRGLHINQPEGIDCPTVTTPVGGGDLRYSPQYGDRANQRVGNGTLRYEPPLADGGFRSGALRVDNLVGRGETPKKTSGPALQLGNAAKPGVYELRMPTSYVYLTGRIAGQAVIATGGSLQVALSTNHGADWSEVTTVTASGPFTIDLTSLVYRRYDYRLRLTLSGAGSGLDHLVVSHDVQHSQRALPALAEGANRLALAQGPAEGTITIEGATGDQRRGNAPLLSDFHPRYDGMGGQPLGMSGGTGSVTFPISTPGDLLRIRFGCHYRARDAKDGIDLQVSFDDGRTFATVGNCPGGVSGNCVYVTAEQIPRGTRQALVRYAGRQVNTTAIFDLRIDADYAEPHGGTAPVKITYVWEENGAEKRASTVLDKAAEQWTVTCGQKPVLKSLIVERQP